MEVITGEGASKLTSGHKGGGYSIKSGDERYLKRGPKEGKEPSDVVVD